MIYPVDSAIHRWNSWGLVGKLMTIGDVNDIFAIHARVHVEKCIDNVDDFKTSISRLGQIVN